MLWARLEYRLGGDVLSGASPTPSVCQAPPWWNQMALAYHWIHQPAIHKIPCDGVLQNTHSRYHSSLQHLEKLWATLLKCDRDASLTNHKFYEYEKFINLIVILINVSSLFIMDEEYEYNYKWKIHVLQILLGINMKKKYLNIQHNV